MGTFAAAPARFGTRTVRAQQPPADASILSLVLTYVLTGVLIILAVRGAPSILFRTATNGQVAAEGGPAQTILQLGVLVIMLALMIPVCWRIWFAAQQHWFLFLLPAWATLSTLWSVSAVRTFPTAIIITISTLFAVYLIIRFTPRQLMQLFVVTAVIATALSFLTVALVPSAGIDHKNSTVGLEGIYPQKNICAVITMQLMTVGFCYAFRGVNAPLKRIGFIGFLTLLIVGSAARTGWILAVLTVGFIVLLRFMHRLRPLERFVVTWFLPAVAFALAWVVFLNAVPILHFLGKDPTLSGRTGVWRVVFLSIVKRPWTGFGYGAFWIGANPEVRRLANAIGDPGLSNAENGVLQLWLELGLVGVILLFASLIRTCKNAVICFRSNTPGYAIWYMSILFITMLSLVDGNKFMLWGSLDWIMYLMADIGLNNEARRVRALRAA
jgi:hypothetical protein